MAPGEAVGVDVDAGQVAQARALAAERGAANARFEAASAYALPYPAAGFDAVFLHNVLQHLREPAAALAEAHRVLRPGGVLGVSDSDFGSTLLWPADPLVEQTHALYLRWWRHTGGDPYLGRRLLAPGHPVERGGGDGGSGVQAQGDDAAPCSAVAGLGGGLPPPEGEVGHRPVGAEGEADDRVPPGADVARRADPPVLQVHPDHPAATAGRGGRSGGCAVDDGGVPPAAGERRAPGPGLQEDRIDPPAAGVPDDARLGGARRGGDRRDEHRGGGPRRQRPRGRPAGTGGPRTRPLAGSIRVRVPSRELAT